MTFKQQIWITTLIKKSSKWQIAKMSQKIKALKKDMHDIEQYDDLDTNDELHTHLAFLHQEHQYPDQKVNEMKEQKHKHAGLTKGRK